MKFLHFPDALLCALLMAASAGADPADEAATPESAAERTEVSAETNQKRDVESETWRGLRTVNVQDEQPKTSIRVGVLVSPPFVSREGSKYSGMAIALWEDVAADLALRFRYQEFPTYDALVDALADKQLDVAVANLTITQDRAARIDLSQPWFDAGLRILVRRKSGTGMAGLLTGLCESGYAKAYAWLSGVILLATFAFAIFYRRFDEQFPETWREGIAESFYSVMSLVTSGKSPRRNLFGWFGTILASLWLVCGVAVVAYVTSTVTSVLTTLQIRSHISGLSDLPGKRVGVLAGSVAATFAQEGGFATFLFPDLEVASKALQTRKIDALIGDSPSLEHFVLTRPDADLAVVGRIFHPDKYGFGLQYKSPLTRRVTLELLERQESGSLRDLRRRYFGATP